MTQEEIHKRTMNLNAHFAWAIGMWGSASYAKENGNFLMAPIGFYYSTFHAGFSLLNTDHTMHLEHLSRTSHSALKAKLDNHLDLDNQNRFVLLREIRENINYLGMGEPNAKLRVVRGHPYGFDLGTFGRHSFFDLVDIAEQQSKDFILYCLSKIEKHCTDNEYWRGPKFNDWDWYDEYLQEDAFITVIPEKNRQEILKRAFGILMKK